MDVNITTCIVWVVRIVLPILFFWFWYRTGPGKGWSGSTENVRTREEFLAVRKAILQATEGEEPPEPFSNLRLVEEVRSSRGESRPGKGKKGKGDGKGRGRGRDEAGIDGPDAVDHVEAGDGDTAVPEAAPSANPKLLTEEERMHLESLLNFVAFSHKDRPQRVFLPDTGRPPPPPKKRPQAAPPPVDYSDEADSPNTRKANSEAQMVVKGVINAKIGLKRSDIPQDLYQQLVDSQVRISEETFSLMVQACINAGDLKGASGFLMKMELAGLSPDSDLLDKVMDLYAESRSTVTTPVADPIEKAALLAGNADSRPADTSPTAAPAKADAFGFYNDHLSDED